MDELNCHVADTRRTGLKAALLAWFTGFEGPTWLVAAAVYLGWFALTWWFHTLPWWLVLPLGGWFVCWHGSLQHEVTHGHPSRLRWLNAAVATPPLGLWMPFELYRQSHLQHHRTAEITIPGLDPESHYVGPSAWHHFGVPGRVLLIFNNTLLGRMTVGPVLTAVRLWSSEIRLAAAGNREHLPTWAGHALLVAVLMYWVVAICQIAWWQYVLLFAWPGLSLTLLRSYAEHRPDDNRQHRSIIVEGSPLSGLLYLNNNLHALHHALPSLPWYELPATYAAERNQILEQNGGYRFSGYRELARRYFLTPKDSPLHAEAVLESAR